MILEGPGGAPHPCGKEAIGVFRVYRLDTGYVWGRFVRLCADCVRWFRAKGYGVDADPFEDGGGPQKVNAGALDALLRDIRRRRREGAP